MNWRKNIKKKKTFPYADMSKFDFKADFDKNAVFQGYHIWFKDS